MSDNQPPYTITSRILSLVAEIIEELGSIKGIKVLSIPPSLRRGNRIKTIQASLAIEGNTLSLEQVTDVIAGKRVLGLPREIQEVKNAFAVYERLGKLSQYSIEDMLEAHKTLMYGLIDEAGMFRHGNVGIARDEDIIHVAPPAGRVYALVTDLLKWLKETDIHPLVASSIFHYEFEFIHPFADGNGRMGRLWQTLILSQWQPIFALLPVETVVCDRQQDYYNVLRTSDESADGTLFAEFMLASILQSLQELSSETHQVTDQVTPQVEKLLGVVVGEMTRVELQECLGLKDRVSFKERYLNPAITHGFIEMTVPDKPNSRLQKYRLTNKGKSFAK